MAGGKGGAPQPLEDRIARYERIVAMRSQTPPMTYEAIGAVLGGLTKERIRAIEAAGKPKRPGRPSGAERADRLRERLTYWEGQLARGRAGSQERVDSIAAELARVTSEAEPEAVTA